MAQQGAGVDHEQLWCSLCLDPVDTVNVPCGHSYCRTCIEGYWNQDDQRGRFSCPQCRQTFIPRPVLKRNTMLAEVVESLKNTGLIAAPPDWRGYAGPGDVACDVCTPRLPASALLSVYLVLVLVVRLVNPPLVSLSTPAEPKTRAEFLQYSRPITLDPNTAHDRLSLSKGNRKVTGMSTHQSHPRHPERFTGWWQVLSREALSGRWYSEVQMSGDCYIAVSYKDIGRNGFVDGGAFGYNDRSWSLDCTGCCTFVHSGIVTDIPGRVFSRVGVYLDHSAGTLSFYGVSDDTMTVLHTVHTTFTHNLHVGLGLYYGCGSTAELCELN